MTFKIAHDILHLFGHSDFIFQIIKSEGINENQEESK